MSGWRRYDFAVQTKNDSSSSEAGPSMHVGGGVVLIRMKGAGGGNANAATGVVSLGKRFQTNVTFRANYSVSSPEFIRKGGGREFDFA